MGCYYCKSESPFVRLKSKGEVCQGCFDIHFFRCNDCHKVFTIDESPILKVCNICSSCRNTACKRCGVEGISTNAVVCRHCFGVVDRHASSVCEFKKGLEIVAADGSIIKEWEIFEHNQDASTLSSSVVYDIISAIGDDFRNTGGAWNMLSRNIAQREITWAERKGEASLVKRISAYLNKTHKHRLSIEARNRIGSLVGAAVMNIGTNRFMFTRNCNLPPRYFCNEDSCWWGYGGYGVGRCCLKQYGGFAFLAMDNNDHPIARAWVMPITKYGVLSNKQTGIWVMLNYYFLGQGVAENMADIFASITGTKWTNSQINDEGEISTSDNHTFAVQEPPERVSFYWEKKCACYGGSGHNQDEDEYNEWEDD